MPRDTSSIRVRQPNSKAFERLQNLGEEKFTKILNLLMRGQPAMNLAREMQQKWGDFTDVAQKTLTQQLSRLRLAAAEGAFGPVAAKQIVEGHTPQINALAHVTIPTITRLEELAAIQRDRVLSLVMREKMTKIALSITNDVTQEYRKTLLDIQKIRFELGLDEFKGPVGTTTMRGAAVSHTFPDGTNIQKQVFEAVTTLEQIFDQRKIPRVN